MFESLTRIVRTRARRRTEQMLDRLPLEIQKDIGWRWSPSRREPAPPKLPDWNFSSAPTGCATSGLNYLEPASDFH